MSDIVLMERDAERMNVPAHKVAQFLENGWKEISRQSAATETPQTEAIPPSAPAPVIEPAVTKSRKAKAKT